ncbi:MAG: DUF2497 domain-containing protein [Alphaproteobacteria bacterium]|nr:DUF2497 domain-containing protein [Alphaproteobacteria bacterium]
MSEPKAQEQEPSMEEILASIRRIISEDGAEDADKADKAEAGTKSKRAAKPEPAPAAEAPAAEEPADNVLELTRMVQDDGSVVNLQEAVKEVEAEIEIAEELPEAEPLPEPAPVLAPTPKAKKPTPVPPAAPTVEAVADPLLSRETAAASGAAFAQLARMVAAKDEALRISATGRTIEDIVVDLLRPLLKDWLDENLPLLVERLVKSEIERIVKGQTGQAG